MKNKEVYAKMFTEHMTRVRCGLCYKLQTVKFLEINWLSQHLATARLENFLARNLTLDYYNKLETINCNRFSTILCYILFIIQTTLVLKKNVKSFFDP